MDLCYLNGKDYVVVIDYFSRWLEIVNLEDTGSATLVRKLKNMFARWGIPDEVRSDMGSSSHLVYSNLLPLNMVSSIPPQIHIILKEMEQRKGQYRPPRGY